VGVFTNLTHDHLDAHGSPEHYLASKAQLFVHLPATGTAVLNAADPSSELLAEVLPRGVRVVRYGLETRRGAIQGRAPDLEARDLRVAWDGTRFRIRSSEDVEVHIQAIGEIYAENALAALGAGMAAGVPFDEARAALAEVRPPAGRFEVVRERPHVVVDYAHTPDALGRTIAIARALLTNARKGELWLVFGAGGDRDRKKRAPMGAAASAANHVVLTSDNPRHEDPRAICDDIREGLSTETRVELELDREAAIRRAVAGAGPDDIVLVAGKGHETEQIVGDTVRPFSDVEAARRARRDGSRDGRP
jgi:UDP-N-acetylmuramoyl-L-alanyl-D-glutamate--2,6-diaminopimelate ligase